MLVVLLISIIRRKLTFSVSDRVVGFLAGRRGANGVDGNDAERVDRKGLQFVDHVLRPIRQRRYSRRVPVPVLADSVV